MHLHIKGIRSDNIMFFDNAPFLLPISIIEDVVGCGV